MNEYYLNIADYIIKVETGDGRTDLAPAEKFSNYLCRETNADITLRVNPGNTKLPPGAELVFNAPFIEEINGKLIKRNDDFWKVWKGPDCMYITCNYPYSTTGKMSLLTIPGGSKSWELTIHSSGGETDPLEYPLDGLLLYYLTALNKDIFIHASGADFGGRGFLFSGVSGKGKTTMARLCENAGAKIIHDDRLIIRKTDNGYFMHNTPVYRNETPASARLDRIFLLEHSTRNEIIPLSGASGVSRLMANCIQHNWNRSIIDNNLGSVSDICSAVPVSILRFRPDKDVINEILTFSDDRK